MASPRTTALRILIPLIAATSLLFPGTGTSLASASHPSEMDSRINAKLAELNVKPSTVEPTSEKALRVRRAIAAGDFKTAERITADIRARSRVQNWRYYPFEDYIAVVSAETTPQFGRRLDEWVATDPANALPLLLRAQYFCDIGWSTRGSAFTAKTNPDRMAGFVDDLKKALTDVNAAMGLDTHNPYSFYLRLRILRGYGVTHTFSASFAQAITKYPAYYRLYEITLDTFQPRWSGSIPAMYRFVDRYAGAAPQFSPLKLLYLRLYRDLLGTASLDCSQQEGNTDKTVQCIDAYMQKVVQPGLEQHTLAALQLYDHTDKYEFGIVAQDTISGMLTTPGGDTYSGALLQLAATSMHSDTQLKEEKPGHNDYVADELVAQSWYDKEFSDNALAKYKEALTDTRAAKFPGSEERDVAVAQIFERLSEVANEQHQYADEIAFEKAAVRLGVKEDEHYICYAYYVLKQYDEAVHACSDAIDSTGNAYARYWRGKTYDQSGRAGQALTDLTQVAEADGYFAPYAAVDMSMIYFNRNDNKGALGVLNKYAFLYDTNRTEKSQVAVAYNNRCYAYMKLGFLKKALDDCTQSVKYGSIPDAFRKEQELMQQLGAAGSSPASSGVSGLARSL